MTDKPHQRIQVLLSDSELSEIDRQSTYYGVSRSAAIGRLIRLAAKRKLRDDRRQAGRPKESA